MLNGLDEYSLKTISGFQESLLAALETKEITRSLYLTYLSHVSSNLYSKEKVSETVSWMEKIILNASKVGWSKAI